MSKSAGQIIGGVVGGVVGLISVGPLGAAKGFLYGSTLGGVIDPPPGPDLKGPTLDDVGFNSAAYGVALPRLFGAIAVTGSIIYLENNEYKAVSKKQKTGGKGGGSKGSYTTTTYFATFAVALGEAMPGSKIRRVWAGGKLIYSVGEGVDSSTLIQSKNNQGTAGGIGASFGEQVANSFADVERWHYYDGSQAEPDSRMEAVLGVGNCPSYEGTAYIIFYDFDLTEYGNGLQGCPIKVELITEEEVFDSNKISRVYNAVTQFEETVYEPVRGEWVANVPFVRGLTLGGALFMLHPNPSDYVTANANIVDYSLAEERWRTRKSPSYNSRYNTYPGLTFGEFLNWKDWDITLGNPTDNAPYEYPVRWQQINGVKISYNAKLISGSFVWNEEAKGATYGGGYFYFINGNHIVKLSTAGTVALRVSVNNWTGLGQHLWFDEGLLYRAEVVAITGGFATKVWVYDGNDLSILQSFQFGNIPSFESDVGYQFAVYGGVIVIGWGTRLGALGGELHYEQWRFKDFTRLEPVKLDSVVGQIMNSAGVGPAFRDLTALESDVVAGYRITDIASARGSLSPLQTAYLFDLVDMGYKITAVKRGGLPILTIPYAELGARASGDSFPVVVKRDRETDSQLPSRYTVNYIDYNREYDSNSQYQDCPSRATNERAVSVPVVLSADKAAQLADVLVGLSWVERDSYVFTLPQKYVALRPSNVVRVEVSPGLFVVLRIASINCTVDQRIEISARRAEAAVYQSSAVGVAVTPPGENIPLALTPKVVMLDIPAVNSETATAGFGAVMYAGPSWKGGALLRSVDNSQSFDAIQGFNGSGTLGRAIDTLADADYFVMDRVSVLKVDVAAGDFFAITESQMLTGKNYCAYGVDGRWEIIQYTGVNVVSDTTVELSGFLRGLFGTEWAGALHAPNDWVVLLDDADNAFIGSDLSAVGAMRKFKGVSTGQDAQLINDFDFVYRAANLKPLAPANVKGYIESEVWYISVSQRTRLPGSQWATGVLAPMGEESLKFEFEIYDGVALKNTYQATSTSLIYSSAQQMADFGYLPTSLTVKVYQISAAVGRGFPAVKTLVSVGDIYSDKVVLLLHFNGADNSTLFTDSSINNASITAVGNAKITTSDSVYGGACAIFDGAGDYIQIADSSLYELGSADFTLEGRFKATAGPQVWGGVYYSTLVCKDADGQRGFEISLDGVSGAYTHITFTGWITNSTFSRVQLAFAFSLNVWYSFAVVREASKLYIFINGILINPGGTAFSAVIKANDSPLKFGAAVFDATYLGYFTGKIDEFRWTSHARYSSDYSLSLQPFPDPI